MIFSTRIFPIKRETKYFRLSKIVFFQVQYPCVAIYLFLHPCPARTCLQCWVSNLAAGEWLNAGILNKKKFTKNKINKEKNKNLVALKTSLFSIFQSF